MSTWGPQTSAATVPKVSSEAVPEVSAEASRGEAGSAQVRAAAGPHREARAGGRSLGGVLALPLVWAIRGYQLLLSPLLAQQCRFYPSCSAYAVTALQRYGPVKGSWLALRRLGRCHPWNPGGVDHVPAREHESGAHRAVP